MDAVGHVVSGSSEGIKVPALSLREIAGFFNSQIDFMNIDIEGLDETVILDDAFDLLNPTVLAIEQFADDIHEILVRPSTLRLIERGYALVARAGPTSIYRRR